MPTLGVPGLLAAYIFLAVLLLSINLYSKWSWPVKAATIVLTSILYFVTYVSFRDLLGWPTHEAPPQKFRMLAAHIEQPNKLTGDDGAIFVWLADLRDLSEPLRPRAYELPYSAPLHERIIDATAKLNKGKALIGEFKEPDENARIVDEPGRLGQESTEVEFFEVPDPLIPDK